MAFCLRCPVMTHGDSGLWGAAIEWNGLEFGDWVWVFSLLLVICVTMSKVTVALAIPPWGSTVAVDCWVFRLCDPHLLCLPNRNPNIYFMGAGRRNSYKVQMCYVLRDAPISAIFWQDSTLSLQIKPSLGPHWQEGVCSQLNCSPMKLTQIFPADPGARSSPFVCEEQSVSSSFIIGTQLLLRYHSWTLLHPALLKWQF